MTDIRYLEFGTALTNVEDAIEAIKRIENEEHAETHEENLEVFLERAREGMDEYPSVLPFWDEFDRALTEQEPRTALRVLAEMASYVRENDPNSGQFDFSYQSSNLDRVEEAASRRGV